MPDGKKFRNRIEFRPTWAGLASFKAVLMILLAVLIFLSVDTTPALSQTMALDEWIDLGWDYYNAGKIDEAFNTFLQAADEYPDSALAHLALGEVYLEMGQAERGRTELLTSMGIDDESETASRAHYLYGTSLREEDPWNALLHLDRAHKLGGTPSLQFEIAHQMRFCRLMIMMPKRTESGEVILHYPDWLLDDDGVTALVDSVQASQFLTERFCHHDISKQIHIFIHPTEIALWSEIAPDSGDNIDPVHREFHVFYSPDLDFLNIMSAQVIFDLQQKMNRHAGALWVVDSLPSAITGSISWDSSAGTGETTSPEAAAIINIGVDDASRSLNDEGAIVDLVYLTTPGLESYVPDSVRWAEMGSFLRWLRNSYSVEQFQELITQPNFEAILGVEITELQGMWLEKLNESPSLLADPALAAEWAKNAPVSPLAGQPNLPLDTLKEGLSLYLGGDRVQGLWQIRHALELDPGLALGYYSLGWIAVTHGDFTDAENQLGMAVKLFETPGEIAWCHSLLAPIYLHDHRWDLARASLEYIANWAELPEAREWATESLTRVIHLIALKPIPVDRSSGDFDRMRNFFIEWNMSANSDTGVAELISGLMAPERVELLIEFYRSLHGDYPGIIINHAVQTVGVTGSSYYIEVNVQAASTDADFELPPNLESLTGGGYIMFFQVVPDEDGLKVYDWEDANFPINPVNKLTPVGFDNEPDSGPANPGE